MINWEVELETKMKRTKFTDGHLYRLGLSEAIRGTYIYQLKLTKFSTISGSILGKPAKFGKFDESC